MWTVYASHLHVRCPPIVTKLVVGRTEHQERIDTLTTLDYWIIGERVHGHEKLAATMPTSLPLDAHEWFQPGHLPGQFRVIRRIDHLTDIFVGTRRFFGDAANRRTANQNPAGG